MAIEHYLIFMKRERLHKGCENEINDYCTMFKSHTGHINCTCIDTMKRKETNNGFETSQRKYV